jgi:hypothetical protein
MQPVQDSREMENFKILRTIWKNTYDKILEIKVTNRRSWNEMKKEILEEERKKIDAKFNKEYNEQFIMNKMYHIISHIYLVKYLRKKMTLI